MLALCETSEDTLAEGIALVLQGLWVAFTSARSILCVKAQNHTKSRALFDRHHSYMPRKFIAYCSTMKNV